jgi:hypothetical protein
MRKIMVAVEHWQLVFSSNNKEGKEEHEEEAQ